MAPSSVRLSDLIDAPVTGYWGHPHRRVGATVACRVVRNGDVAKDGVIDAEALPARWFTAKELSKAQVLTTDAVLVSSGAYTGNVGRLGSAGDDGPVIASNFVRRLRPRPEIDPRWLFHLLRSSLVQRYVWPHTAGSAIPNLGSSFYRGTTIDYVPLEAAAQRRIAEILDTVDGTIRKTEQLIAKLKQLNQGMLHDLLTRGIDEHGELRDRERQPEQFKDSRLGPIPKEWTVHDAGELLASVIDFRGRTPRKLGMSWGDGDIPALSAKNVRVGHVDLSQETYYGSESLYARWMTRGDAALGDVLLTTEAPLGNVAQVPDKRRYILSQRVVLLKFEPSLATNDFMAAQMRHWRFQQNLIRWSTGTTATGIQMAKMVLVPVVKPPLAEQGAISRRMSSVERRLSDEVASLAKLKKVKTGLSEDLLTGRVRVLVGDDKVAA